MSFFLVGGGEREELVMIFLQQYISKIPPLKINLFRPVSHSKWWILKVWTYNKCESFGFKPCFSWLHNTKSKVLVKSFISLIFDKHACMHTYIHRHILVHVNIDEKEYIDLRNLINRSVPLTMFTCKAPRLLIRENILHVHHFWQHNGLLSYGEEHFKLIY